MSKLFLKKIFITPWFLFIAGLIVGVVGFGAYNYFTNRADQTIVADSAPEPVVFNLTDYDHILGNPTSQVALVVFNDLTCPYSKEYFGVLDDFMQTYQDKIKLVWRHFPLDQRNAEALNAAEASECAAEQNKFWEFVRESYANQERLSLNFYLSLARDLNLDEERFQVCLTEHTYQAKVEANYHEGIAKGVNGTPISFLNGRVLPGVMPYYDLAQLIDPLVK